MYCREQIAGIMSRGGNTRREGMSRYNKIYEYEYMLFGRCDMTMTSVSGHLLELEFLAWLPEMAQLSTAGIVHCRH
jgi:DNA topoisomerase-3